MTRSAFRGAALPALFTALALAVTTLGLVTTAASPATAAATQITEGSVTWGVKESWRKYIGADGSHTGDGATVTNVIPAPSGTGSWAEAFRFPIESGTYDPETRTTTLDLAGYVHFQSWFGQITPGQYALDTKYSDLTVTISATEQVIRGTHAGYDRTDPGGEMRIDEDVVLAKLDITGGTQAFGPPRTTWTDVPTVAGAGASIYGEGTTIDPVTIDYAGPGGKPDLTETFDQPGQPVLDVGPAWSTGSTAYSSAGNVRTLLASGDPDRLFSVVGSQSTRTLVVTAIDARTMTSVGTPYTFTFPAGSPVIVRPAIDPKTDTIFFVTTGGGDDGDEATVRSLTFADSSGTFTAAVVGSLGDLTGRHAVSPIVWNPVKDELIVFTPVAQPPSFTELDDVYRFSRAASGWDRKHGLFAYPDTPTYAAVNEQLSSPLTRLGTEGELEDLIAVAGDGSYVVAPANTYLYYDEELGDLVYAPAVHLSFSADADDPIVAPIEGTTGPQAFGTYYGYMSATAGPDGSVYLHNTSGALEDWVRVDVENGVATAGEPVQGPPVTPFPQYPQLTISQLADSMTYDPTHKLTWAIDIADAEGKMLKTVDASGVLASYRVADFADNYFGNNRPIVTGADGTLYLPIKDTQTGQYGWRRVTVDGIAPRVTTQPQDVAVELEPGEASRSSTFTVDRDTELGGDIQWQRKAAGETRFSDVPGATASTLKVSASPTSGGEYRAKVTNAAGVVVSDVATLDVTYGPRFAVQPVDVRTQPNREAHFSAEAIAAPGVTSTVWQRRSGGYWVDIPASDDNFTVADGALTVDETDVAQSGSRFRLKAVSPLGTAYSSVAELTVDPEPAAVGSVTDATLQWSGSAEMQAAPPFGGSSFFSAGVSDGKEPTYRASEGNVSVVHVDGATRTPATWATRAAHVGSDSTQTVIVTDGSGRIAPDGSARIAWDASWTVNFYGGLIPFTVTDPVLTVAADGSGTLTGDLSGYASSQATPDVREPVAPVEDVVISTFDDVTVDPAGFTVTPDYRGVEVEVPDGASPQVRTGSDWGAWPQQFVDFHGVTGLTSYWYSSGGAADPLKAGTDIVVGPFTTDGLEPVVEAPKIVAQPSSTSASIRRAARFAVGASGTDLAHQWQRKVGSSWLDLSDERGPVLALDSVSADDDGAQFRVRVSNSVGSVTSAAASLDVTAARTSARLTWSKRSQAHRAPARKRVLLSVRVTSDNGTTPKGKVRFYDGKRRLATVTVTSGRAKLRLPRALRVGSHRIKAVFTPTDAGSFGPATTTTVTVKVRR